MKAEKDKANMERDLQEARSNWRKAKKISLTTQLEDNKRLADAEARDRSSLMTKYKNLTTDLESSRERIENEHERKSDSLKALSKAQAEINCGNPDLRPKVIGEWKAKANDLTAEIDASNKECRNYNSELSVFVPLMRSCRTIDVVKRKIRTWPMRS
ncbi:hypothetical protein TCAL_16156 [Tigriopus californicus]|uniref:Uncharacterized protein n=1 Tax=Tigriopus californicus TaxID=6832 RepID=A0A553P3W4_TIGCA|nr:hypothetical protein TCAL_16156 [Tigriopus californicus]